MFVFVMWYLDLNCYRRVAFVVVFFDHFLFSYSLCGSLLRICIVFLLFRIILYAIAMADYDQENTEICEDVLTTKDGIDRLALYNSSVGRSVLVLSLFHTLKQLC